MRTRYGLSAIHMSDFPSKTQRCDRAHHGPLPALLLLPQHTSLTKPSSLNFSQFVEGRRWCQWTREGIKEARVFAGDAPCHGTKIPRACARSDARQKMRNGAQEVYRSTVVTSSMAQVLLGEGSAPGRAACPSSLVPSSRRNGGGPHGAVLASLPFGGRTMRSGWARVLTSGAGVTPSAVP